MTKYYVFPFVFFNLFMTPKHYHFIGIGGIGISAIARYYKQL